MCFILFIPQIKMFLPYGLGAARVPEALVWGWVGGGHEYHGALEHFSCNKDKMEGVQCISMATDMFTWPLTYCIAHVITTCSTDQLASAPPLSSWLIGLFFPPRSYVSVIDVYISWSPLQSVHTSCRCRRRWSLTSISNVRSSHLDN